jgi:bacteriorhodopsin
MFIGELTFYGLVGATMAVAFVFFAVAVRHYTGRMRRYMIVAPFLCGALSLGYFAMSAELLRVYSASGRAVPLSRFIVYYTAYTTVVAYIGVMGGASRKHLSMGVGFMVVFITGTIVNWYFVPPVESLGKLLVVSSMVGQLWILAGPFSRAAESVSGPRRLAFGKMRNLMALLLLMYFIVGLTSRQGLGFLGTFTGIYMGGYMDVLGHIGMAALVLRSEEAVTELAGERSSVLAYFRADGSQASSVESTAGD